MITTTQYTITVTETELKKNFAASITDLLSDHIKYDEDIETFESDLFMLQDNFASINKSGFRSLFKEGFTPMLLSQKDFEDVEDFFRHHSADDSKLQIIISKEDKEDETVEEYNISYWSIQFNS